MNLTQAKIESRSLRYGGVVMILGMLAAAVIFRGQLVTLFGPDSIGSVASVMAALAAFGGFLLSWTPPEIGRHPSRWIHRTFTGGGIALMHAAIGLLLTIVLFYLIKNAFEGVELDPWTASVLTGLVAGIAGYAAYLSGWHLTSMRLATTLGVFMATGAMASMITAPNPYWWQIHFSSLGGGASGSATAFNATLILGGIVIIGLADSIAADYAHWQARKGGPSSFNLVRLTIAAIGVLLACVGIFPYDTHLMAHNLAAGLMTLVFLGLITSLPHISHHLGRTFAVFSYALAATILACAWLYLGVGYLNLTSTELIVAGVIFAWIIVFVRHIAAGLSDADTLPQLKPSPGLSRAPLPSTPNSAKGTPIGG
jgi:hypothetical protein